MRVFPIELQSGTGGVLTEDITRIVPHHRQAGWSLIYTLSDPDGLMIRGDSKELCAVWHTYLEAIDADALLGDDDDDDELLDGAEAVPGAREDSDDED